MNTKQETRDQVRMDLIAFFAKGGRIKKIAPKKLPVNRKVT